jgi:hypothetical protein
VVLVDIMESQVSSTLVIQKVYESTLLKVMKIGSITYTQIYRAIAIIVILIILALVVGLVVVPKVRN